MATIVDGCPVPPESQAALLSLVMHFIVSGYAIPSIQNMRLDKPD